MKIHEYQAKKLFSSFGIPIDKSLLCKNIEDAVNAYEELGKQKVVIKAQVLAGGRGKAGGVKLANNREEVKRYAGEILGMNIKGFTVDHILVGEAVNIHSEYYLSLVIDRNAKSVVLMLSKEGGVDIEEVARTDPKYIFRFKIDASVGMPDFFARKAAFVLFDDINLVKQTTHIIQKLYHLFIETDASLAEINPLVLTKEGDIVAIDAKITFDDNALYRHPDIHSLYDPTAEEKKEIYAKSKGFSYVGMYGNIGCLVNGAGLAMATMDMIQLYGGKPANFLDIGGSSNPNKVIDAMKLLLEDSKVKVVLINIFGGITRCDDVANGLIEAFRQLNTDIPIIVRLTGTNEEEGRNLLRNARFHIAGTMEDAAKLAVSKIHNSIIL